MPTRFSLGRDGNAGSPPRAGPSLRGRVGPQGQPLVQSAPHAVGVATDGAASPAHPAPGALSAPSSPLRSSKRLPNPSGPRAQRPPAASIASLQYESLVASSSPELTTSDPASASLREHFRPEESPSDVETLHELNPSVVTMVPDFGFSPTSANRRKAGKKTNLGAARAIIRAAEAASPDAKTKLGRKTRQLEASTQADEAPATSKAAGVVARASERTPVAARQVAGWTPSSAQFVTGGGVWERKLEAPVSARLPQPAEKTGSPPSGTEVAGPGAEPPSEVAGQVSVSEPGARMQARAGLELSPLKLRARRATAGAAEVKAPQSGSPGQSARTVEQEPLPFMRVFGIVDDLDTTGPKARPEEGRARAPRGRIGRAAVAEDIEKHSTGSRVSSLALEGNNVGESSTMLGLQAGPSAPVQASPPLLNPTLRALCLEDRTGSFGSGAFVVDDFLSSLAAELGGEKATGCEKVESGSEKVALPGERAGKAFPEASGKEKQRGSAGGSDVVPPSELQSRRCVIYNEDWDLTHRSAPLPRHPRSSGNTIQTASQVPRKSMVSRENPQSRFGQVA